MASAPIPYYPSDENRSSFWSAQDKAEAGRPRVPDGFPEQLVSPLAWTRESVEKREGDWIFSLTKDDVEAIESALAHFEGKYNSLPVVSSHSPNANTAQSNNPSDISRESFPLAERSCWTTASGFKAMLSWNRIQDHSWS